jgi:excisionase family DNA binding protein
LAREGDAAREGVWGWLSQCCDSTEGTTIDTDHLPDVMTVEETATLLRISRGLAFAAVRSGEIPSVRVGRRILVPKARLLAWLENRPDTERP